MGNMFASARPAEPPPWASPSAADRTALGVTSSTFSGPDQGNAQTMDTKKKGFFDSIRDFFSK